MAKGKVLLAEDDLSLGFVIKDTLQDIGFEVTHCPDGEVAWQQFQKKNFDICLLDINMPGLNGIEVAKKVTAEFPQDKIIILTMYKEKEMVRKAMNSGASGYILKDFAVNEIIECINNVLENKKYIGPGLQSEFNEPELGKKKQSVMDLLMSLSQAELKTLKLVNQNKSSKEIAELLFLSEKTIENYRSKICQKLGLPPRNNSLILWTSEHKDLLAMLNEF